MANKIKDNVLDILFNDLGGTPSFVGESGKSLQIKDDESGLFLKTIVNRPNIETHANQFLKVKSDESGLDFIFYPIIPNISLQDENKILCSKPDSTDIYWDSGEEKDFQYLSDRLTSIDTQLLQMRIDNGYAFQKSLIDSNFFYDCIFNLSMCIPDHEGNQAQILTGRESWNYDDVRKFYKNGVASSEYQRFILEMINEYNLEGVGQAYTHNICYDSVNNCYWMTSSSIFSNGIDEITRFTIDMYNGRIHTTGKWFRDQSSQPLGTQQAFMCGIAVTNDGQYLILTFTNNGSSGSSGVAKLSINSDGTVGRNHTISGGNLTWLETWTSNCDFHVCDHLTRVTSDFYPSCVMWDDNHFAIFYIDNTGSEPRKLIFKQIADDGAGAFLTTNPRSAIDGFEKFMVVASTNACFTSIGMAKQGNDLYIKINQPSQQNYRFIYKFVISEDSYVGTITQDGEEYGGDVYGYLYSSGTLPKVVKASGRFNVARDAYPKANVLSKEGICIGHNGDFFEIVSNADGSSTGQYLARRALNNALWAENQIDNEIRITVAGTTNNQGVYFDDEGYVWYGAYCNSTNNVRIYRRNITTGAESYMTLNAGDWNHIYSIAFAGSYAFLIGYNSSSQYVSRAILKTTFVAALGGNLNVGSVGYSFQSFESAKTQIGVCSDGDYLYVINDSDDAIDKWSIGAQPEKLVDNYITLPPADTNWYGIAYKNNKFYIPNYSSSYRGKIFCFDSVPYSNLPSGYTGLLLHIYQSPARTDATGMQICSYNNSIYQIMHTQGTIASIKTLEDPDVLQIHTFLNKNNILLSHNVTFGSDIVQRTFAPEDFNDIRDCPHNSYCGAIYGDITSFSILFMDNFLTGKSSTGKNRHDIRDIITHHYLPGTNKLNYFTSGTNYGMYIVDDIVCVGNSSGGLLTIFLKEGIAYRYEDGSASYSGTYFNGKLNQRNLDLGYAGKHNPNLNISNDCIYKIHGRTFTKNDQSDYDFELPSTYILCGTGVGANLLVINYDSNNNRVPTRIWGNIFDNSNIGLWSIWLAPSGQPFGGYWNTDSSIFYGIIPVWHVNSNSYYSAQAERKSAYGPNGYCYDISPNSICYKSISGQWKHITLASGYEYSADGVVACEYTEIESNIREWIYYNNTESTYAMRCIDRVDDRVFVSLDYADSNTHYLYFLKKLPFNDYRYSPLSAYKWSGFMSTDEQLYAFSTPRFTLFEYNVSGLERFIRYSRNASMLLTGTTIKGIQIYHFPFLNDCEYRSIKFDCDSPLNYNYIKNAITPNGFTIKKVLRNDASYVFTNGSTINWQTPTETTGYAVLGQDSGSQGFVEIEIDGGYKSIGIYFAVGVDKGESTITVTKDPNGTPSLYYSGIVDLYAPSNYENEFIYWITLDSDFEYKIKVQHNGSHNISAIGPYSIDIKDVRLVYDVSTSIQTLLKLTHTSFDDYEVQLTLNSGYNDITQTVSFVANGTDDTFIITSDDNRAYIPIKFGKMATGGTYPDDVIWYDKDEDSIVTWGSNGNYNDEIIDANKHFGIKWVTPPSAGNVYIQFAPYTNKAQIKHIFKLASAESTNVDYNKKPKLLDYGLELI